MSPHFNNFLKNISNTWIFGMILTQFFLNFSRQEHQIELFYVSTNFRDSQVTLYPLSLFLSSLLNIPPFIVPFKSL